MNQLSGAAVWNSWFFFWISYRRSCVSIINQSTNQSIVRSRCLGQLCFLIPNLVRGRNSKNAQEKTSRLACLRSSHSSQKAGQYVTKGRIEFLWIPERPQWIPKADGSLAPGDSWGLPWIRSCPRPYFAALPRPIMAQTVIISMFPSWFFFVVLLIKSLIHNLINWLIIYLVESFNSLITWLIN